MDLEYGARSAASTPAESVPRDPTEARKHDGDHRAKGQVWKGSSVGVKEAWGDRGTREEREREGSGEGPKPTSPSPGEGGDGGEKARDTWHVVETLFMPKNKNRYETVKRR